MITTPRSHATDWPASVRYGAFSPPQVYPRICPSAHGSDAQLAARLHKHFLLLAWKCFLFNLLRQSPVSALHE